MSFRKTKNRRSLLLIILIIGLNGLLHAQAVFSDISIEAGFNNTGSNRGVAIADYDNDGDDDVYVSSEGQANFLYRNNGDGTYTDVAAALGVDYSGSTHASVWGDFDNDGNLDLYLGNKEEPNVLYHNNGNGSFVNIAETAGVDGLGKPRTTLVADIDRDGFLDIYVANLGEENAMYKNNGDLTFTNVVMESGTSDPLISMGAMFFDYDNDGDSDLYLSHDANQANILYQNDGAGNFTDVSVASGANYAGQGMGVDFGDINNDGWLDFYITNLSYNTLYLNNGDGTFSNISFDAMITDPGMGWGVTFFDYDNDGFQDIYMVNDSYFSPLPNILYRNKGDQTFEIVSENTPIASMYGSYGTACTDINGDGLVDVFVGNHGDDGNQLFRNETTNTGNWLRLKLIGTISNRLAIGSKVTLEANGQKYTDEVAGGSGYASQNSYTLHFGLGDIETIDQMTIQWTNGLVETFQNISVNESLIAIENESLTTGAFNVAKPNYQVKTFPNPTDSDLNIMLENETAQTFEIYISNLLGEKIDQVFSGYVNQGVKSFQWMPSEQLNAGIYLINVQSEKTMTTKKVFIVK